MDDIHSGQSVGRGVIAKKTGVRFSVGIDIGVTADHPASQVYADSLYVGGSSFTFRSLANSSSGAAES